MVSCTRILALALVLLFASASAQAASISNVTPESGPVGSVVTISGSGFGAPAADRFITFGGIPAISYPIWTDTQIQATVAGNAVSGVVEVILGTSASKVTGPIFTVMQPTITGIAPSSGPAGTNIVVTGTNLGVDQCCNNATYNNLVKGWKTVLVNGVPPAAVHWVKPQTEVHTYISASATTGHVEVAFNLPTMGLDADGLPVEMGRTTLKFGGPTFTVTQPTITGISPTSGPVGTNIVVTGTSLGVNECCNGTPYNNLVKGWKTVLVNDLPPAAVHWVRPQAEVHTYISANATTGPVEMAFDLPTTGFDADGFPVETGRTTLKFGGPTFTVTQPTITNISPTSGPVGTNIVVTGTSLGVDECCNSAPYNNLVKGWKTVLVNGVPPAAVHWVRPQAEVHTYISANVSTGPVEVVFDLPTTGFGANGFPAETGRKTLKFPGPAFTVTQPEITSISPTSGPVGTNIVVTGTSLGVNECCNGAPYNNLVKGWKSVFVGVPLSAVHWVKSQTEIHGSVAGNAVTGPVELAFHLPTTGFGATGVPTETGTATLKFVGPMFTVSPPSITAVSPATGPIGTRVTLSGRGFGTATQTILFNDHSAPVVEWSDTQVTTDVPGGVAVGTAEIELSIRYDVSTTGFSTNGRPIVTGGHVDLNALNTDFIVTNTPPSANAGMDQTGRVGDIVTVDGSSSFDPNGQSLTFAWSFVSLPPGSLAILSAINSANPQFTIDKAGSYDVQLVVNDGHQDSEADTVTISTINSSPVAAAGADQGVTVGQVVQLDGSSSFDPDGDALVYQWTLVSRPPSSAAMLSGAETATPTFTADAFGNYEARLIVNDGSLSSDPDGLVVSTVNVAPVASAGVDQAVSIGTIVYLDGRESADADGQELSYSWSFMSRPEGSAAAIDEPSSAQTSFLPDVAGTYLVQLVVNDGLANGQPDSVSVTAVSGGLVLDRLRDAINELGFTCSDPTAYVNRNSCRALVNKLEAVSRQVEAGSYNSARNQLNGDVLPKMDGCVLRGSPDAPPSGELRDWIVRCDVQEEVYSILREAVERLTVLIGT